MARQFAADNGDQLKLFHLPPYSPELNPDEWVSKNVKNDRAGRMAARSIDELKKGVDKAVHRRESATRLHLSTAAKHGISFFDALITLTEGRPWMPTAA